MNMVCFSESVTDIRNQIDAKLKKKKPLSLQKNVKTYIFNIRNIYVFFFCETTIFYALILAIRGRQTGHFLLDIALFMRFTPQTIFLYTLLLLLLPVMFP